ncbi:MAG TPA: DUF2292 domain-containing protein [Gemmataceae bacterium]|nr:DUF2292 domain-containing protein [Gemmataceae bacterium]
MNPTALSEPAGGDAEKVVPVQAILQALRDLQFGSVTLVVQDGVVVQVERVEKTRLARRATTQRK